MSEGSVNTEGLTA